MPAPPPPPQSPTEVSPRVLQFIEEELKRRKLQIQYELTKGHLEGRKERTHARFKIPFSLLVTKREKKTKNKNRKKEKEKGGLPCKSHLFIPHLETTFLGLVTSDCLSLRLKMTVVFRQEENKEVHQSVLVSGKGS